MNPTCPKNDVGRLARGLLEGQLGADRASRAPGAPGAGGCHYSGRRPGRVLEGFNGLLNSKLARVPTLRNFGGCGAPWGVLAGRLKVFTRMAGWRLGRGSAPAEAPAPAGQVIPALAGGGYG